MINRVDHAFKRTASKDSKDPSLLPIMPVESRVVWFRMYSEKVERGREEMEEMRLEYHLRLETLLALHVGLGLAHVGALAHGIDGVVLGHVVVGHGVHVIVHILARLEENGGLLGIETVVLEGSLDILDVAGVGDVHLDLLPDEAAGHAVLNALGLGLATAGARSLALDAVLDILDGLLALTEHLADELGALHQTAANLSKEALALVGSEHLSRGVGLDEFRGHEGLVLDEGLSIGLIGLAGGDDVSGELGSGVVSIEGLLVLGLLELERGQLEGISTDVSLVHEAVCDAGQNRMRG